MNRARYEPHLNLLRVIEILESMLEMLTPIKNFDCCSGRRLYGAGLCQFSRWAASDLYYGEVDINKRELSDYTMSMLRVYCKHFMQHTLINKESETLYWWGRYDKENRIKAIKGCIELIKTKRL